MVRAPAHLRALLCAQGQEEGAIVFLSPKLVCNALDRASPDAERLGHLQDAHALLKLLSHLAFGPAVYLRPTELHGFMDDFEACITHLRSPVTHRRAIRTTNLLERLFSRSTAALISSPTPLAREPF